MTTFGAMREQIAKELGDPDDSRWTAEIEAAIVQAITDYEDESFWFSQDKYVQATDVSSTTTVSIEYVDFPTSPALLKLDNPNGLRIKPAGATDIYPLTRDWSQSFQASRQPAAVSTGTPFRYIVRGEMVLLDPIPDSSSHTLYWSGLFRPTTLITAGAGDSQTNVWMTKGAPLIRNRAKKIVARDTVKDGALAIVADSAETEALEILRKKTDRRLRTGRNRAAGPGQYRSRR